MHNTGTNRLDARKTEFLSGSWRFRLCRTLLHNRCKSKKRLRTLGGIGMCNRNRGVTPPGEGIFIEGIEADAKGVWLYGQAYIGKEPARFYLERIDFEQEE